MEDEALVQWVDGAFEFLCTRRVDELVDTGRVLEGLEALAPRTPTLIARLLAPARGRAIQRFLDSELLLAVWLPDPVKDALAQLLGTPVKIPRKWIDKAVADERVREQIRTAMQEALSSAVQKGFSVAPGGRGLKGMIGLAGAAGRGLLGGFAAEIEDRLRDLVDAGVQMMQQRVAQKLASQETAEQLGKRRRRAFLDLMKTPEKVLGQQLQRAPHDLVDAMAPALLSHNLQREEVAVALREEVAAALTELSKQPIGELLDELGLRPLLKEAARAHAVPLLREFLASPFYKRA